MFEVSESFEYEAEDDLETPDPFERQVGNRPKRPGKGKHSGKVSSFLDGAMDHRLSNSALIKTSLYSEFTIFFRMESHLADKKSNAW